jgi:hypothetical protein
MREEDNEKCHITHPQSHEQLLVGWITGGMTIKTTSSSSNNNEQQEVGRRTTTHRPPPASQATAHGVGRGWNTRDEGTMGKDDNDTSGQGGQQQHTTHPQPCEPLLMGWNDEDNDDPNTMPLMNVHSQEVFF